MNASRPCHRTPLMFAAIAAFAMVSLARSANASPDYPDVVQSTLGLSEAPSCNLCHTPRPGRGTVNTPFGKSLRARGAVASNAATVEKALAALEAERTDSNGDGISDIDSLRRGLDPNEVTSQADGGTGTGGDTVREPAYGCGARVAPSSAAPRTSGASALAVACAAFAMAIARRRRG